MNAKKVTILLVFTILLIFSVVSKIFFNDFQDGWNAYEKKNYKTARELWLPLAEQGDIKAQFFMGFIHDMALGVPENNKEAIKWYQLAAEQGDSRAQLFAGFLYDFGVGVPGNDKKAIEWYQLAAEQGENQAKNIIYNFVKKNSAEARKILLADAAKGSIDAQVYLENMNKVELQISQDYQKGLIQVQVAEEQEYVEIGKVLLNLVNQNNSEDIKKTILDEYRRMTEAQETLGRLYAEGQRTIKNQNKTLKWYNAKEYSERINKYNLAKKNAVQELQDLMDDSTKGIIEAQFILATMYANGQGVLQDNKKAFKLFYRVAKINGAAQLVVEEERLAKKFIKKNIPQELKFLTNDAEAGNAVAQFQLGLAYALGQYFQQDYEKAIKWYRLSAEQGNSEAQYALGIILSLLARENEAIKWFRFFLEQRIILFFGQTTIYEQVNTRRSLAKRNVVAALKIIIDDAEDGIVTARYYLGDLYRDGIGLPRHYVLAYMWYNLSAIGGNKNGAKQMRLLEKELPLNKIQVAQELARTWTPKTFEYTHSYLSFCINNWSKCEVPQ
jgi:uncharacterized protein